MTDDLKIRGDSLDLKNGSGLWQLENLQKVFTLGASQSYQVNLANTFSPIKHTPTSDFHNLIVVIGPIYLLWPSDLQLFTKTSPQSSAETPLSGLSPLDIFNLSH